MFEIIYEDIDGSTKSLIIDTFNEDCASEIFEEDFNKQIIEINYI